MGGVYTPGERVLLEVEVLVDPGVEAAPVVVRIPLPGGAASSTILPVPREKVSALPPSPGPTP